MSTYAYVLLAVGTLLWMAPFLLKKRNSEAPLIVNPRARWGILLVMAAYSILGQSAFWARPLNTWRLTLSIVFFALAALLSWTGAHALGRQWRVDAGLNKDHELIRSGPYRLVRHPIYTSMLCFLFGIGFLITPPLLLLLSLVVFMIGTEIRVRIEDALLASQFGEQFYQYKRSVPAYIPFLK
jgi:protein-S-isoprenylcysteine O-methyltransferase Ste14